MSKERNITPIIFLIAVGALLYFLSWFKQGDSYEKVYIVYDQSRLGEKEMVCAAMKAMKVARPKSEITEIPNAKFSDINFEDSVHCILITAGQFGIDLIRSQKIPNRMKVLLCVHQWFDGIKTINNIHIALPNHVINEEIERTAKEQGISIITTTGVLHVMSLEELEKQDTSAIRMTDAKVGLVLAGNAEMPNGKDWKMFDAENARNFAKEVAQFYKKNGHKILITNGPRTGAHLHDLKKDPNAHKNGMLDQVSKSFLDQLALEGLKKDKDFEFFDFQFGKPSQLKPIMAIIKKNNGFMITPGESTSSISEITSVLPAVIYENSAMNDVHKLFVSELTKKKLVNIWPDLPGQKTLESYQPIKSEAHKVIRELLK